MQLHSMLTHRSSTEFHRNSTPTNRNSTATHPTSTAIHPTSTAIHPTSTAIHRKWVLPLNLLFSFSSQICGILGYHHTPYKLIVLPNNVRVCYGCGSLLKAEERSSPNNVVIRHFDRRFIRRDESTGQPVFFVDFKNTYYHLDVSHVRRKNPYFDGKVTVSIEQYHSFDSAQNARISSSSGFQIMLT